MRFASLLMLLALALPQAQAQGTVPTFRYAAYSLAGRDPAQGANTTIPTVLVPVKLSFEANRTVMDAGPDVPAVTRSPLFSAFAFPSGKTQYADGLLRATFPKAPAGWHTLLGKPEVRPVSIAVPVGYGYILTSKKSGRSIAIADVQFVQTEIFKRIPKEDGKLVIAVTHNTAYYSEGDATLCCSWGNHGVDPGTGNSFVLGTYLRAAPAVVEDADVQPLSQQLAEFVLDPVPGNKVPAWMRPGAALNACGGTGIASAYFRLEPTDSNPKNNFPASKPFLAQGFHLQNAALLPWYIGPAEDLANVYSFPDPKALPDRAAACPSFRAAPLEEFAATPVPSQGPPNGHKLIGYWAGYGNARAPFPLRDISPQWDIVIVAFAVPDKTAPEGTLVFRPRYDGLKSDIAFLKNQGRKVMISLGGGGQHFTLADPKRVPNFVSSVKQIVTEYGFDGIDIDFESPSLSIAPGDTDFRNPTTPSIVNLISALRQLKDHFGKDFMISLVPEGTQIPAGYPSYGGQFGSYLPIAYALRDILSFMDVQDYNTPPLQGLDGEIYQPGTVDYHAAMTELVLEGFKGFPPLPSDKVAVGFFTPDTTPQIVSQAMDYIITGKAPAGTTYKLRNPSGYPGMIGAMFWTINADRSAGYNFSNVIGPQLHRYPPK